MTDTQRYVTVAVTTCAGLSAGVFFAFSTFVMPALNRLHPSAAIEAMQQINKAAPNGAFMTVLFAPLLGLAWLVVTVGRRGGSPAAFVITGAACFVGGLLVLMGYHVPHNDALAKVSATAPDAHRKWRDYYAGWTAWNHVRTLAFTAATALFALALRSE
jgi:uncharacterized membrane protein